MIKSNNPHPRSGEKINSLVVSVSDYVQNNLPEHIDLFNTRRLQTSFP